MWVPTTSTSGHPTHDRALEWAKPVNLPADVEVLRRRLSRGLARPAAALFAILTLLDGRRVTKADLLGRVTVNNVRAK